MPQIRTRTDEETKTAFKAVAEKRQITESRLLDELIAAAIATELAAATALARTPDSISPTPAGVEPARMNLRMPGFLLDGAKTRAQAKHMTTNRWVVALLQTHLTGKPVVTDYEIAILRESNRELAAIGRNLNQIAKALNESFHETDRVKSRLLADLATEIKVNRQATRNLIKASLHAWSFEA